MYVRNTSNIPLEDEFRLTKVGTKDKAGDYTWETKLDVATKIVALGNMRLVSEMTKIPYDTIRSWKKADWWPKLVDEVKAAQRSELNSKLGRIVQKALDAVEDRIDNGDFVLSNKTGEVIRKPVGMKDVNKVASDLLGQQIKLDELSNQKTVKEETMKDVISQLANEFAKFNKRQLRQNSTEIDFKEVQDALHEERETRLQEGSGEVYFQTGSSEEESGAEQSSENDGEGREST